MCEETCFRATNAKLYCVAAHPCSRYSAFFGGIISGNFDYSTTFLITVALQLFGALIHATLIGVIPREQKKSSSASVSTSTNDDTESSMKEPLLSK